MNPHALRRRNLNPVGVYRDAARCSERRISPGGSLHLAAFRYSPWTIQRRFPRPLATATGRGACSGTTGRLETIRGRPQRIPRPNKPLSRARRNLATCAGWPPLLSLSYPKAHGARDLPDQAERTEGQGAYSDVIRSAFRRHSISVPKVSDQDSGAIRSAFRSFDQPFRAFDQSRPSG